MRFQNEYAFLSNIYGCKVEYEGEIFPCAETAFQFAKCNGSLEEDLFMNDRGFWVSGYMARKIGRSVKLRDDWEEVKNNVMLDVIRAKFYRNEGLRKALLATGDIELVEDNDWGDTYWGKCNGKGKNMLGVILMKVRKEIRDYEEGKKHKRLKIIVAGGRDFDDYALLKERLDYYFLGSYPTIICGEAKGADSLGRRYAEEHELDIISMPADWKRYGKSAGFVRNGEMAAIADGLVAFWDGKSSGTKDMIARMTGKQVRIVRYTK